MLIFVDGGCSKTDRCKKALYRSERYIMRLFMHTIVHVVLIGVMLWLAYDFTDNYPTFGTATSYKFMAQIMPEENFGILCGVVALGGIVGFFTNSWRIRVASSALLAMAHIAFAIMFFIGNPHAPAAAFCLGNAILGFALAYSYTHLANRLEGPMASFNPSR